ncbi:hypothetical protein AFLA_014276 [Aspergillus flavus NRRL3357]|nr:hypothetical protein AFLA_014276 [Aspergillus flavus NRRL3357]
MPGIMSEQDNISILNLQLKKRKRDPTLSDAIIIPNTTKFIPTTLHTSSAPFCLDCPNLSGDNIELSARQRCIPRKRRALQQPYIHPQSTDPWSDGLTQPPESSIAQVKMLSPNIYTSGSSNYLCICFMFTTMSYLPQKANHQRSPSSRPAETSSTRSSSYIWEIIS